MEISKEDIERISEAGLRGAEAGTRLQLLFKHMKESNDLTVKSMQKMIINLKRNAHKRETSSTNK